MCKNVGKQAQTKHKEEFTYALVDYMQTTV
jgi:hypothetical protein